MLKALWLYLQVAGLLIAMPFAWAFRRIQGLKVEREAEDVMQKIDETIKALEAMPRRQRRKHIRAMEKRARKNT